MTRARYTSRRQARYPTMDRVSGLRIGCGAAIGFVITLFLLTCLFFLPKGCA